MSKIRNIALSRARNQKRDNSTLATMVDALREGTMNHRAKANQYTQSFLSLESINDAQIGVLDDAMQELHTAMESAVTNLNVGEMTTAQMDAGQYAAMLAGDVQAWRARPVTQSFAAENFTTNVGYDQLGGEIQALDKRIPAFEAYDEKENRDVVVYSMAYNMQASRQSDFGEAFFPTITVSPSNVGYSISIRLINVFNGDLKRDISGAVNDFGRRNIIRAAIDASILRNDSTRIVPVHRAETAANFVANGDVTPTNVVVGRETVLTAPLKTGASFSLIGIASTPALIANGLTDTSDAVDTAPELKAVYVKLTSGADSDVFRIDVSAFATNNFVGAVQGQHRLMNLNFDTRDVMFNANTKRADGSNPVVLANIATQDVIVYLGLRMSGSIDLQTATTAVYGNSVYVVAVKDAAGQTLSLTGAGVGKDIADAFAAATTQIIGYDLTAYRTNSNLRQRGDQLDTMYWRQQYSVPLLSPISVARPVVSDGQTDTSDLGALITTTQIRASNAAVTKLLATATVLSQFVDNRDKDGEPPALLGVGRFLVRPTYFGETLNVADSVDSRTSHERAKDIQAVVVNKLRDVVYRMYVESGFKAAADAMNGGNSKPPTVIIGTDQELARYLQVDGDLRTIGPDFDVKVVHTVDSRMKGKIAVAFGYFNDGGSPDPLHFGNMIWKPELTTVLPISRNGQTSKELTVMPSFVHIVNCPVLSLVTVTGIQDVIASKVAVNTEIL